MPVFNINGEKVGEADLPEEIFSAPVNEAVMHQALVRQLANARLGTHKTKGRSEVSGGGRKPWRQKGTGRARQGTIRAPQWKGGGTVFGPQPRSYEKDMSKKMRRLALRSALTVKAAEGKIILLDDVSQVPPKTRDMSIILYDLNVEGSALVLIKGGRALYENVYRAAHNLPDVKTLHAAYLNVRDLLGYDTLIIPLDALEVITEILGQGE